MRGVELFLFGKRAGLRGREWKGIRYVIFIELQGTSDYDTMILCCIFVIVTLIKHHHAAIPILYVGVWVGIDCCEHVLYKESAPGIILYRIAECHRISRRGLTRLCNIQAEDARVFVVVDDLTTLEELYWR